MSFKSSRIYRVGYELALDVERICKNFPRHEQYALAEQLRNSSRSTNYVEGYVRQQQNSLADQRRFLIYSKGSCDETKYWLQLAKDMGLLSNDSSERLQAKCSELGKMIFSILIKSRPDLPK